MKLKSIVAALATSFALALASTGQAQHIKTWTATDGDFYLGGNWDTGSIPEATDIAVINNDGTATISAGAGTHDLGAIRLGETEGSAESGHVIMNGGTWNLGGTEGDPKAVIGGSTVISAFIMNGGTIFFDGPDRFPGSNGDDGLNGLDWEVGERGLGRFEMHNDAVFRAGDDIKIGASATGNGSVLIDGNARISVGSGISISEGGPNPLEQVMIVGGNALVESGNSLGAGNPLGSTDEGYLTMATASESTGRLVVQDNAVMNLRRLSARQGTSLITVKDHGQMHIFDVFNGTGDSPENRPAETGPNSTFVSMEPGDGVLTLQDDAQMTVNSDPASGPTKGLAISGPRDSGNTGGTALMVVRDRASFSVMQDLAVGTGAANTSIGTLEVIGPNVTIAIGGNLSLAVDLDGVPTPGKGTLAATIIGPTHSTVTVTNTARIANGYLKVTLSGYVPVEGESFTLITAGSVEGQFLGMDFSEAPLSSELTWQIQYNPTSVVAMVGKQNSPPLFTAVDRQTVSELETLTIQLVAVDTDLPLQKLTFRLDDGPPGMNVNPDTGLLTWTPTEADGPGVAAPIVSVTDDGTPSESSSTTFLITILQVNLPPIIEPIADRDIPEGSTLELALVGSDPDFPPNPLVWSLAQGPAGMTVEPETGLLQWVTTEADGISTNVIRVRLTDESTPPLSAEQEFTVVVREINQAPVLAPVADQQIDKLQTLSVQLVATDVDLPTNTLTYRVVTGPAALTVNPQTGLVQWTTTYADGGTQPVVQMAVDDDGTPPLSATNQFTVTVRNQNTAPQLAVVPAQAVNEGATLSLQLVGSDGDLPAQTITYTLLSGPTEMTLNANSGLLEWTTQEKDGPGNYPVNVEVRDDGTPSLATELSFTVTVVEANQPPVLASIPPQTGVPGQELLVPLIATDPDVPPAVLTYGLVAGPVGSSVVGNDFQWRPSEPLGTRVETVTVRVQDDGSPRLSDTNSFTVTVASEVPVISITSPTAGVTTNEIFTLAGQVTDNAQVQNARWYQNNVDRGLLALTSAGAFSKTNLRLFSGDNRLRVVAVDAAGNRSTNEVLVTWRAARVLVVGDGGPLQEGQRATVPITLESQGEVAGAVFDVEYDSQILAEPQWEWVGAAAASFNSVTTNIPGLITATFGLAGGTIPAGPDQLARVTFRLRSVPFNQWETLLTPVINNISDAAGDELLVGTKTQLGTVQITQRTIIGDNNANQRLDTGDASVIQRLLAVPSLRFPWDLPLNDVNSNDNLDIGDVIRVLRVVTGLDPQPTPGEGFDLRDYYRGSRRRTGLTELGAGATVSLSPVSVVASSGSKAEFNVVVAGNTNPLVGASFEIAYPTNALRLVNTADNTIGPLVPVAGRGFQWNIEPLNTYPDQNGLVHLAVSTVETWPQTNGVLATFRFTVEPTAGAGVHEIVLGQLELTSEAGYRLETFPLATAAFSTVTIVEAPVLEIESITANQVTLLVSGSPGEVAIEEAADLSLPWFQVETVTLENEPVRVTLPVNPNRMSTFYRARPVSR